MAALGALVFAGVRRELERRFLECAAQLEQPHPVQTAEDRLDLTFPAHDLHLCHGDEHVLTPRSCHRPGGSSASAASTTAAQLTRASARTRAAVSAPRREISAASSSAAASTTLRRSAAAAAASSRAAASRRARRRTSLFEALLGRRTRRRRGLERAFQLTNRAERTIGLSRSRRLPAPVTAPRCPRAPRAGCDPRARARRAPSRSHRVRARGGGQQRVRAR